MSDIKLFRTSDAHVEELEGHAVSVEKSLQTFIERHLEALLGIRFLASEYPTGQKHGGRIDTLGIDENDCPVIIEYKRATNQNVINQGLFYLDWLLDHEAEFERLATNQLGPEAPDAVEWGTPRLLCIAGGFTKYDEHAVNLINRNIELMRYRRYGEEFLLFELVNATSPRGGTSPTDGSGSGSSTYKTVTDYLEGANEVLTDRYESLKTFMLELGDDVQMKTLKYYIAFKRIKNFACVELRSQNSEVLVYLKVDPTTLAERIEQDKCLRDVSDIGHFGTGDLELRLRSDEDLKRTQDLIERSYDAN